MRTTANFALIGALLITSSAVAQNPEPIKFARFPHVANDGTIAFTYQDDIWVANPDGSSPRRLTAHVARDVGPRFSPDGKWIAFTSNRMGNNDVFVMPVSGGEPRQLTYLSIDDQALYWTPDGKEVVFASARGPRPWGSPMYRVGLDGSIPTPMGMDIGRAGMVKQDMTMVAFNRVLPTYWRKGYRGNNSGDIAVQDLKTGEIREITDTDLQQFKTHVNDVHPMWGADGMIYFASERDGTFNLWRVAPSGGAPQQITRHKDDGVQFPAISPDGRRIIYENEFDLWTVDVPTGQPRKLTVAMAFDPKENSIEVLTAQNRADGFAVSPTGDYLAVDYHGEIVAVPTETGIGEKLQVTNSPWRERGQEYSPDGRRMAYISDESGEEEIWIYDFGTSQRRKLTAHESVKGSLTWAPNSQKLAFTANNRLYEIDAAGGAIRELANNPAGGFSISQYSADGAWLVYVKRDDDQNADVFLFDVAAKREYNVTKSPFNETAAELTPDGKSIVFTSNRNNGVNQLFVVSLTKLSEDPNDPLVRERQRRQGGGRREGGGDTTAAAASRGPAPAAAPIRVDVEGIDRRATQLTRGTNAVGNNFFLSRDGRTVYYTIGGGGGFGGGQQGGEAQSNDAAGLYSIAIEGRDPARRVASGTFPQMTPTVDRRTIFFTRAGGAAGGDDQTPGGPPTAAGSEIHKLTIATPQRTERVSFAFPVRVDRKAEWNQLFEEAYRVMKYRFYDEKMHGRDWAAIKSRYKPLLKYVGTNEDVYDLANEMIGELNASHTGVSGPPTRSMPRAYVTRYLGFELEPAGGKYRVSHLYKEGPADKEWLDLKVGDYVLAIDGQEIKAGDNYWKLLSQTMNEYIPVRVAKTASGENAKTLRIASVTSLTDIKYEEWVAERRAMVEKETNGHRVRPHPVDEPAVTGAVPQRDRSVLEQERHHRGHPLQRRRQHRPGADRHPRAAAVSVLE